VVETIVAIYCVVVGSLMVVWWAVELRRGAWNREDRTRAELGLHLAGEFLTAGALIVTGLASLVIGETQPWTAVALGMLLYTTIVSPGYFVAHHEWPVVVMFGTLAALTLVALVVVLV
jgi:hypothetical protein